ncbi:uncharacterized protein LOC114354986 [Ostrinia furnacalis]|uniref:uncharacterized protein LOC114354986 n=1 Tax=Ostrinia furnacalis TaxID=93504 RepID=UPI00103A7E4E|nr:uncharacterized protein LOC114354986 [Ostrinia furnacalis]
MDDPVPDPIYNRATLDQYNDMLAEQNDNAQIIRNYKVALEEFPGNIHFLYSAGEYFLRQQEFHIAHLHFEKAVQIDKNLVKAQKYLNLTKRLLYSRDEYRLLNDDQRLGKYLRGIIQTSILRKEEEIESKESAEQSIQHSFEESPAFKALLENEFDSEKCNFNIQDPKQDLFNRKRNQDRRY